MKALLILSFALVLHAPVGAQEAASPSEPLGPLTLRDAVEVALARNPTLRAAAREVRVREALSRQAAALPNPEVRGEVENVGGSGAREGFEETESTLRISQLIELGGKRAARRRIAASERDLAMRDHEGRHLEIVAACTRAFVTTLAAQQRLALATESERLAREVVVAVRRSVAAGAAAPVETAQAQVALGRVRIERAKAERELAAARTLLASTWGSTTPRFARAEGDLTRLGRLPSEAALYAAIDRSPELARWVTERSVRRSAVSLEHARRVPDVTVGAGARHFSDNGDNALVFELSVPLPLFDRNREGIGAAHERLAQAEDEAEAAAVSARASVAGAYQQLGAAHEEASALAGEVLPEARRAAAGTLDAFQQGSVRPVDVLEAQRALFEVEAAYVAALERFHGAAADLERLTADGGDR